METMQACIKGRSRCWMAYTVSRPKPGYAKTVSTTTISPTRKPRSSVSTVIVGAQHAECDADDSDAHDRHDREAHRVHECVEHDRRYWALHDQRVAEVAVQDTAEPAPVLQGKRVVQPELLFDRGDRRRILE